MKFARVSASLLAMSLISAPAQAARRIIQFAGLATAEHSHAKIGNMNRDVICTVAVVNTGGFSRQVLVEGLDGATLSAVPCAGTVNIPGTGGIPAAQGLTVGGSCYATYMNTAVAGPTRRGLCAGRVTITDPNGAEPGSVVAAGSMSMVQEIVLEGGQLSGAIYTNGQSVTLSGSYNGVSNPRSGSMNVHCPAECLTRASVSGAPSVRQRVCEALCGLSHNKTIYGGAVGRSVIGSIEDDLTFDPTKNGDNAIPRQIMSNGSPFYAGGIVHEIQIGPERVICNANSTSDPNGATTMPRQTHQNTGGFDFGQEEFLFCGHRHRQPDLFFSLKNSQSFVINGGMAF